MLNLFILAQLQQIRKMTIAGLLCKNGDTMKDIQPRVLLQPFSDVIKQVQ